MLTEATDAPPDGMSPTPDSDAAVLARVATGDLLALDELYERYGIAAYSMACRITADEALAQDVVQEAYLGVWHTAALYDDERESVESWLLAIVHRRALDAMVRASTSKEPEPDAGEPAAGQLDAEGLDRVAPDAADDVGDDTPVVEPPASLRGSVLAAAAADLVAQQPLPSQTARATDAEGVSPGWSSRLQPDAIRASFARRGSPRAWAAAALAVVAIVVLALGAGNLGLQRDLDGARSYQADISAVIDIAGLPGSQMAILTGETTDAPSGLAAVSGEGDVAIILRALAPTSGTEVYEAWAIGADGTAVPIGSVTAGDSGLASITASGIAVEPGVTISLTREPAPGATVPTLPIVASGEATAPPES